MMPPLLMKLVFTRLPAGVPGLIRPIARAISDKALKTFVQPQIDQMLVCLESELAGRDWFAGAEMTFPGSRIGSPASMPGPPTSGRWSAAAPMPC
jgi:glutathione S-transferase